MLKLALTNDKTSLIPCRKHDARQLVNAYGNEYGVAYDKDVDGYQYRSLPLSMLPMLADDFSRIIIEQ